MARIRHQILSYESLMTKSHSPSTHAVDGDRRPNRLPWVIPALATYASEVTVGSMEPVPSETLAERLFPEGDFAFGFGMQRPRQEWFRWSPPDHEALQERRHWLSAESHRHLAWTDEAAPVLQEALTLFPDLPFTPEADPNQQSRPAGPTGESPREPIPRSTTEPSAEPSRKPPHEPLVDRLRNLSLRWEPDVLLLRRDTSGQFRLVAGAVCFPSAWDLREKVGKTVDAIHAGVPTLNAKLGERIRAFLDRLPAGQTFERDNWGLAAHGQRNAHPDLALPRLTAEATLDTTWLRLEHQAFRALPESGGLLFAIHLTVHPLGRVLQAPTARDRLARQLRSMPDPIAAYKGILPARDTLVRQLGSQ